MKECPQQWHVGSMRRPSSVTPLADFKIRLVYPDGVSGILDLSADVGRGVFAALADIAFFRTVHIGKYGQISWSQDIEICPDAAYEDLLATTMREHADARG